MSRKSDDLTLFAIMVIGCTILGGVAGYATHREQIKDKCNQGELFKIGERVYQCKLDRHGQSEPVQ